MTALNAILPGHDAADYLRRLLAEMDAGTARIELMELRSFDGCEGRVFIDLIAADLMAPKPIGDPTC